MEDKTISLSDPILDALKSRKDVTGQSRSEICRSALIEYLEVGSA